MAWKFLYGVSIGLLACVAAAIGVWATWELAGRQNAGLAALALLVCAPVSIHYGNLLAFRTLPSGIRTDLLSPTLPLRPYDALPPRAQALMARREYGAFLVARATYQYYQGDASGSADLVGTWIRERQAHPKQVRAGEVVSLLTAAGRYAEALAAEPWVSQNHVNAAVEQINLAEAEFNVGRWSDAWARLERIPLEAGRAPIVRAGRGFTEAWILAHLGLGDRAATAAYAFQANDLPVEYRAECHFARCAARLAQGRLDDATVELDLGTQASVRASSKRNALFLRARIAAARGEVAAAIEHCRAASEHPFRGQGGDGLLLWGDLLANSGRGDEARHAWALVIERDGESESAGEARERLKATHAPANT